MTTPTTPAHRTTPVTPAELLALHLQPARAGRAAAATRAAAFGDAVWIKETAPVSGDHNTWPQAVTEAADVVVQVDATPQGRRAFVGWLLEVGCTLPQGSALAPYSTEAAGLHRLWCLAAARLALPAHVRVQVRHDVVSIRLAQVALGFGVDTFAGPLQTDRKLPLAGVTRPDEATRAGIATLIEAAGLRPVSAPSAKNPSAKAAS